MKFELRFIVFIQAIEDSQWGLLLLVALVICMIISLQINIISMGIVDILALSLHFSPQNTLIRTSFGILRFLSSSFEGAIQMRPRLQVSL